MYDNLFVEINQSIVSRGFYKKRFKIGPEIYNLLAPIYEYFNNHYIKINSSDKHFEINIERLEKCADCSDTFKLTHYARHIKSHKYVKND